jgi:predicted O-methyltransferase YrrM
MTTIGEDELQQLRSSFRAELSRTTTLSPAARAVVDEIIGHPAFPGVTDPSVLGILSALVRVVQPQRVLQIGTYIGLSAVVLGDVLSTNERPGSLWTIDPDETAHALARTWVDACGMAELVTFIDGYSTDDHVVELVRQAGPFELIYLDSSHGYEGTLEELRIVFEDGRWLADGGLLALHDAAVAAKQWDPTGEGGVRRALDEWRAASDDYDVLILEPPFWPNDCGFGLVARRGAATSR